MAPRTRARKARDLNHTARGLNNTSFGESTHASTVDQVEVEKQPIVNLTHPQNNTNGTSNTIILEIHHS